MSIIVRDLSKQYGAQKAVDQVSFELKKGEITGFLGPNGAGKSTCIKMITGYLKPDQGYIEVCGEEVSANPIHIRRKIGYLPEHNPLYKEMYVVEYLMMTARFYRLGREAKKRVDHVIEWTRLAPEKHKPIHQLSKGYRQRVGLAQAMLHNPETLILDEPASGFDPNQLSELRTLFRELGKDKTILLSSHIMQEVEAICDRVIILHQGKKVADGAPQQLQQLIQGRQSIFVAVDQSVPADFWKPLKADVQKISDREWRLQNQQTRDLRIDVYQHIKNSPYILLELHREGQSLEEVFQKLTRS